MEDENRRLKKMYSDLALDNDILREVIEKKLSKLSTTNEMLDKKYGKHGTAERDAFDEKMMAWYFGDILRGRRQEFKLTQKQLAKNVPLALSLLQNT